MFSILPENVLINGLARKKSAAIEEGAKLLVGSGAIEKGYIRSMKQREKVANTYIGSGIAIPHGLPKDRGLINETAIAVGQFPRGVEWGSETVYIGIYIAAKSEEHVEVLRRITHLLDDQEAIEELRTTTSKERIIELITAAKGSESVKPDDLESYTSVAQTVVPGSVGLHARPAGIIVEHLSSFTADVIVQCKDRYTSGRSLAGLLKLGAEGSDDITLYARGEDAEQCIDSLRSLIDDGLNEDEHEEQQSIDNIHFQVQSAKSILEGSSGSPGIASAPIRYLKDKGYSFEENTNDPSAEEEKLKKALASAAVELDDTYAQVKKRSGASTAAIFLSHKGFLRDEEILDETISLIRSGKTAAYAWNTSILDTASNLSMQENKLLSERSTDLLDVGNRVLGILVGGQRKKKKLSDTPIILFADDLNPSDTALFNRDEILGFCTAKGSPTSHVAITARSLGIPAVVGVGEVLFNIPEQTPVIVDGFSGKIYIDPSQEDIQSAQVVQQEFEQKQTVLREKRFEPAVTTDGTKIDVYINIGNLKDAQTGIESGAEGVGLMRTEFLYLESNTAPDEETQFQTYKAVLETMRSNPVIFRTLDIGGDKKVPYLNLDKEKHSFLGIRGIRFCFEEEALFRTQLRALLRASTFGDMRIMFPMIATVNDFRKAKQFYDEVQSELGVPHVPIGIMVEIPAAALIAEELAREVDFFSVGTNDLTQYTLAMDRQNPSLAKQASGLHPAVLRQIQMTARAADKAGIHCGVCGGIASTEFGARILTGLGIRELSVEAPSIPFVKAAIRSQSITSYDTLASRALACSSSEEVQSLETESQTSEEPTA